MTKDLNKIVTLIPQFWVTSSNLSFDFCKHFLIITQKSQTLMIFCVGVVKCDEHVLWTSKNRETDVILVN